MIIGLVGFISSGKGTVGDILQTKYGFIKESFAKPVKDATAAIFGWNRELLEGETQESREFRETVDSFWSKRIGDNFTPRKALQLMGTEVGRNVFHPNLWVDALENRIDEARHKAGNPNYVITDVRFPNEMKMIRRLGGKIVRVKRGPDPVWYHAAEETNILSNNTIQKLLEFPDIHYSEWAWIGSPDINYIINNEGTLKDLEEIVDNLLNEEYNRYK